MSFLASTIRSTIAPRVALRPSYTVTSAFHTSPLRSGLKESDHSSSLPFVLVTVRKYNYLILPTPRPRGPPHHLRRAQTGPIEKHQGGKGKVEAGTC